MLVIRSLCIVKATKINVDKMDATKRPLLIPPEFSVYAEKHGIFQIYEVNRLLSAAFC